MVEIRFGGLDYRQTLKAYDYLGMGIKEELAHQNLEIRRLEIFFSKFRIVLWLRLLRDWDVGKERLTQAVFSLCQGFRRALPETWALATDLVALVDDYLLPVCIGGLTTTRVTEAGRDRIEALDTQHYWREMARNLVFIDNHLREKRIRRLLREAAATAAGEIISSAIIDEAVVSCERPKAAVVDVAAGFCGLPEILALIIIEEQRFFALRSPEDSLLLKAVFIGDEGDEVPDLNGALGRAREIYSQEVSVPLGQRLDSLKDLCYLSKLGSYWDKQLRLEKIALSMANQAEAGAEICDLTRQAAKLTKLDVPTEICRLYPEFLGHMGAIIACQGGAPETVATALIEHWHPSRYSCKLPHTLVGALLGVADRLDCVCGQYYQSEFKLSQYRSVKGWFDEMIAIIASVPLDISMASSLKFSLSLYESQGLVPWQTKDLDNLLKVFGERLYYHLLDAGVPENVAAALTGPGPDNVYLVMQKAAAVQEPDLGECVEECAEACKLLDRICPGDYAFEVAAREYLEQPEELELFETFLAAQEEVRKYLQQKEMDKVLTRLARLKKPLLRFVDGVDLDTRDKPLRFNRLSLLGEIRQLFFSFGDFSLL